MARVESSLTDLAARGQAMAAVLREISARSNGPAWQHRSTTREFIIGMHGGSPAQSDYRNWRFSTYVTGVTAMYFELWRISDKDTAFLNRAYLSLYRVRHSVDEEEILALHCDPNEPDNAEHVGYKRGPHLHIFTSQIPTPRAHIALNRCHLDQVLQSPASLTDALHKAIVMIHEQILTPLQAALVAA